MSKKNRNEPVLLTQEGLNALKDELKHLIEVEREQVIEEIKDARNQGDLSENAEYDAARDKQGQIESRISELEHIISKAVIIGNDSSRKNVVSVGSIVHIFNSRKNREERFEIVGSLDADPFKNKISNLSPLAQALIGHKKDEEVEVEAPEKYSVKIVSIE